MISPPERFNSEDWAVVVRAPLLTAMAAIAGGRGALRATLAVTRAYDEGRDAYRTPLMHALLAEAPAAAVKRPPRRKALAREAPIAQQTAEDILDRMATPDEQAEYRAFVRELVARAGAA